MKYAPLPLLTRDEAEVALQSDDLTEFRTTVAALKYMEDWRWAYARLDEYLDHPDYWVAGNAAIGLSEIARVGHDVDRPALRARLKAVAAVREDLASRITIALGDIPESKDWVAGTFGQPDEDG